MFEARDDENVKRERKSAQATRGDDERGEKKREIDVETGSLVCSFSIDRNSGVHLKDVPLA